MLSLLLSMWKDALAPYTKLVRTHILTRDFVAAFGLTVLWTIGCSLWFAYLQAQVAGEEDAVKKQEAVRFLFSFCVELPAHLAATQRIRARAVLC